jgi:SAM-dependent methyltransferase
MGKHADLQRGMDWSEELISDDVYRTKLIELPKIISSWVDEYMSLAQARILDFGCGHGTTALGFALAHPGRRVSGIDIMPDMHACAPNARQQLGLSALPSNLELRQVAPGSLYDSGQRFDLIYSWSVFEHVRRGLLDETVALLRGALEPNGLLFIQIAPLYFSSEGSHFYPLIQGRWRHLCDQDSDYLEKLALSTDNDPGALSTYQTLNKITADELIDLVERGGFTIIRRYTTTEDYEIPSRLLRIYSEVVLRTNQIALLARRS